MNRTITSAAAAIAILIALTGCAQPAENTEATWETAKPGLLLEEKSGSAGIVSDSDEQGILIETRSGSAGIGSSESVHRP